MVKIAKIEASAHSRPFTENVIRMGLGRNVKRDFVFVKITADDGTVGYGESHHGQNLTAMAEVVEKGVGSLIIGADPFDSEGIWERIKRQQIQTHGLGAGSVIALAGIDLALWDLKGKLLGQPVFRLLGGGHKKIRAYVGGLTLGFQPLDTLEKEVAGFLDRGYTAIKMRVGDTPKKDAERVGHIRKTFGENLDIAVDAATRYTALDLPEVIAYCEKYRVYWLEEPFAPDNIPAYQELSRRTAIPIAAGENHYTRQAFRDLFEARAITIAQADCTKAGGISEVRKIADMAAAWNYHAAPHTSHSILGAAANVHLLCAIQNGLIFEADVAPINPFRTDLARNPLQVVDGYIEPNDAPGFGLDIDESVLAEYPAVPGPCYIPGED
jgi:D-galactarolactone cycloisomerase